jgi:hypothetical protein
MSIYLLVHNDTDTGSSSEHLLAVAEQNALEEAKNTHERRTLSDSKPCPSAPSQRDEVYVRPLKQDLI